MSHVRVYLVRHEEAEPGYTIPDMHRALTGRGRERMRATAKLLGHHAKLDLVITSPLVRAVQTAEVLVGQLGFDEPVIAREIIAHPPTTTALVDLIAELDPSLKDVMLVGHEPTMSTLSAELLGLDPYPRPFKKGSVLALDFDRGTRRAQFRWLILGRGPTLLKDLND